MSLILRTTRRLLVIASRKTSSSYQCSSCSYYTLSNFKYDPNCIARAGTTRCLQTRCMLFNKEEANSEFSLSNGSQQARNSAAGLQQELYKLDYDARHAGKLQEAEVQKIFRIMKETGNIESCDGLLIIRCCGSLIPEMTADSRTRLVLDIWRTLPKLNCQYDVSHYNALLKVFLENEHKFDPVEFINSMEQQGVKPNRITYQHLVSRYCHNGEIEGAKNILESMKTKNLPVNENIFNDLIFGYAKTNNMENAKEILQIMKNAELPPSLATYSALACGYAFIGDIENILATLKIMEENSYYLQDKDILQIIYTLTVNQHGHLVEQVIEKIQFQNGYNNKCMSTILELINKGHHQVAYTLLNTMPKSVTNVPFLFPFIQQLVKQGLETHVTIDYCIKVGEREQGGVELLLLKAAEMSMLLQKPDDAIIYLKETHSRNFQLRTHLFWPVLLGNKGDWIKTCDTLEAMLNMQCPGNFGTFLYYAFPHLSLTDPHSVIAKLQDIGYGISDIVNPLSAHLLLKCDIKSAADLLKSYPVNTGPPLKVLNWLADAYVKTQDTASTVQVLESYQQNAMNDPDPTNDLCGQFIVNLMSINECEFSLLETLLTVLNEKNMKISSSSVEKCIKKFEKQAISHLLTLLKNLESTEISANNVDMTFPVETSNVDQLKNRSAKTRAELYRSLMMCAKNKDLEHVTDLMSEFDESGFVHNGKSYSALMDLFCHHEDLDRAMYYKHLIDKEFPDFRIHFGKIFNLATLLAENKRYDDAEELINSYHSKFGFPEDMPKVDREISKLLNSFAKSENVGLARKLFEQLHRFGYLVPSNFVLAPLIKAYILQNDLHGAVEEFLRIVKTFKLTPCKFELFKLLIQAEDPEILQKVFDAGATIHGKASTIVDLAQAFNDCDQSAQATKLIKAADFKIAERKLISVCEYYEQKNMTKELKSFLQITKDLPGLDKDYMYYLLLKLYVKANNVEKALEIWQMMQEEDVLPRPRTMNYLGSFLQQMNQPVPFAIPYERRTPKEEEEEGEGGGEEKREDQSVNGSTYKSAYELLDIALKENKLSEAVRLIDEILSTGLHLADDLLSQLTDKLHSADDILNLAYLERTLPTSIARKFPIKKYLTRCLSKTNQAEEFLNSLETDVSKHKQSFPLESLLILLNKNPNMLERVKKLVDHYYKEGLSEPRKFLWIHLMNSKRFEEADETFRTTPEMKSHLIFWNIIKNTRKSNDVEISQKLLEIVKKTKIPNREIGIVYSAHINVLISLKRIQEALDTFKESQGIIKLEELNRGALDRLKDHLIIAGMDVPFTVPYEMSRNQESISRNQEQSD